MSVPAGCARDRLYTLFLIQPCCSCALCGVNCADTGRFDLITNCLCPVSPDMIATFFVTHTKVFTCFFTVAVVSKCLIRSLPYPFSSEMVLVLSLIYT